MGIADDLRKLSENTSRIRSRRHQRTVQRKGEMAVDTQAAILAELRNLNRQLAWLCAAVDERRHGRRW